MEPRKVALLISGLRDDLKLLQGFYPARLAFFLRMEAQLTRLENTLLPERDAARELVAQERA